MVPSSEETTMTTKELIRTYNALATERSLPALNGWKASKEALQARIDGLMIREEPEAEVAADPLALPLDTEAVEPPGDAEPDQVSPEAAGETTDETVEPAEHPGTIGLMIAGLLVAAEGYDYGEIVDIVRGEFPKASTSKRSIASVAAALRHKGVEVPMRRKAPKANA
jgi:hypothetical protein